MNAIWKSKTKDRMHVGDVLRSTYEHLRVNGMFSCDDKEDSPFQFVEHKLWELIERVEDPKYMNKFGKR